MQIIQETATKQICYLLDSKKIQAQQTAQRKASLTTDFYWTVSDLYRETQCETNFWDGMDSVIEYRKYMAELNDGERETSEMYL